VGRTTEQEILDLLLGAAPTVGAPRDERRIGTATGALAAVKA
jgi:hypothetical protein